MLPAALNLSSTGQPIQINAEDNSCRLKPNLSFVQQSNEFRVDVATTRYGNRGPAPSESPDTIFLGDSFTFGHGLADNQTFSYIYCSKSKRNCANLGRSGTGTVVQLNTLVNYLEEESWRPQHVYLFMLAMVGSLASGNDLYDNYLEAPQAERGCREPPLPQADASAKNPADVPAPPPLEAQDFLRHSNLARIVYYILAPALRQVATPGLEEEIQNEALRITRLQIERLNRLSRQYGFSYTIFLIHPIQDILRQSARETYDTLRGIAPDAPLIDTTPLFEKSPRTYYYSYDGHLNPLGARMIGEYLLRNFD